jgi:hypothetical protein
LASRWAGPPSEGALAGSACGWLATSIVVALLMAESQSRRCFQTIERSLTAGLTVAGATCGAHRPRSSGARLTQPMSDPRYGLLPAASIGRSRSTDGTVTRSRSLWDTVLKFEMPLPEERTVRGQIAGPDADEALALGSGCPSARQCHSRSRT